MKNFLKIDHMIEPKDVVGELPTLSFAFKDYWKVALPAGLEGVFLNIMLLVDLAMVGALGIENAAAVGIASQPRMIFQMLGMAIATAVTAIVARRHGEKDYHGMNSAIKQSMVLISAIYIVLTILSLVYTEKIVEISGAKKDYLDLAIIYYRYITLSGFFRMLFAPLMSAQIGVGNTKIVFKANIIGNIINVVLNYVMIFGKLGLPKMGIAGAGLATAIGNAIIFLLLLKSVIKGDNHVNILEGSFRFTKKFINPLLDIGHSAFLEHLWERVGLFIFTRMIAELGTVSMGIHHYCILIWDLYYYFGSGMGNASASFSGRKIGEKRKDLAVIYVKIAQRSGIIISIIVSFIFYFGRFEIFRILVNNNNGVLVGASVMIVIAILIVPQTFAQVSSGALRGAGDNKFIARYSLFVSAILRPVLAYIFAFFFNLGLVGMWLALFFDEALKMVLTWYRLKQGIWLDKKV
ncbi:putative efflux protein, MATE family [Peptostreptococcaceae bacterium pGA-8]|nr:putative efflux protein, MATE family [Peptostreptococcaceae bacterium pGA-8]